MICQNLSRDANKMTNQFSQKNSSGIGQKMRNGTKKRAIRMYLKNLQNTGHKKLQKYKQKTPSVPLPVAGRAAEWAADGPS